jgi:hypothetical protein
MSFKTKETGFLPSLPASKKYYRQKPGFCRYLSKLIRKKTHFLASRETVKKNRASNARPTIQIKSSRTLVSKFQRASGVLSSTVFDSQPN